MIRTQIYLTQKEKKTLTLMSQQTGQTQSELIREAIHLLCQSARDKRASWLKALRAARGIWKDRDPSEFEANRRTMDRKFKVRGHGKKTRH